MKLGTETGSLMNHLISQGSTGEERPEIGDGATQFMWSDRHGFSVIGIKETAKRCVVTVQRDHATRVDTNGMSDAQEWVFEPNPDGVVVDLTFRRGAWRPIGKTDDGSTFKLGFRSEFFDFTF